MTQPPLFSNSPEQLLYTVLEHIDEALFIFSCHSDHIVINHVNPQFVNLFGYERASLEKYVGRHNALPFLPDVDLIKEIQHLTTSGTDPGKRTYRCNFTEKNNRVLAGELVLFGTTSHPENREWVAICKYAPTHHETERELSKTTRLLTSIIDNIPTPLFIKNANDLSFVMFNKANETMTGLSNEEVVGKTDYNFFPKEQADFFTNVDRAVIESGEVYDIEEEALSTPLNGQKILRTIKVSIPDETGAPIFLLGISEDITARKTAEKILQDAYKDLEEKVAVRTSELTLAIASLRQEIQERKEIERSLETTQKYLYSIINRLPLIVFAIKKNGICTFSQGKGLEAIGFYPGQLVGTNILDMYKDDPETHQTVVRALNGERFTTLGVHNNVTLEINWVPDYTEDGILEGCYGVSYDITQLKKSEEDLLKIQNELEAKVQERTSELTQANRQLKKLDRMRRRLVSTLTHDLKTPLIAQKRVLQMIHSEASKINHETISALTTGFIKNNTDLLNMINHMLETYELEDGRVNLSLEPVSLVEAAQSCCEELAPLAGAKQISLHNEISTSMPLVHADSFLIKRLFNNLIGNAINHIPPGSKVQLSAQADESGVEVSISDNGKGIDPKLLPFLFTDHFARNVTKRKIGSGLGLYICKMIMELHHGSIGVQSSNEQGTRFYFRFPFESFCDVTTRDYNTDIDQSGHPDHDATTYHLTNC